MAMINNLLEPSRQYEKEEYKDLLKKFISRQGINHGDKLPRGLIYAICKKHKLNINWAKEAIKGLYLVILILNS